MALSSTYSPVLSRVGVEEVAEERTYEARTGAAEDREAGAAHLRRTREIDQPELLGDLPVRTYSVGRARLPPVAHDDVALLAAGGHVGKRDVGDLEQDAREDLLRGGELSLEPRDLVAQRAALGDEVVGVLAGALAACHFLRARIARGATFVHRLGQQATLPLQGFAALELLRESIECATLPHRLAQVVEALADHAKVVHQFFGIESATRPR